MKESRYNIFFSMEKNVLAYNARTNALAEISQEDYKTIQSIFKDPNSNSTNKLYQDLLYGGFLVEDNFDELAVIRHNMYASRFSTNTLKLTIAPTADCNFRCPYCYERDVLKDKQMTDDVENKIIEMIESNLKSITTLGVTWYGGEPLLEKRRIESMSEKIMKLCNDYKVDYFAGIITNGYFLDSDTLLMLAKYKVRTIQITLDGVAKTHDQRRYLKNKGKTFGKIMKNLIDISILYEEERENLPNISLRINVDKNNKEEAFELLDFISNSPISRFVAPYIAGVYDHKDVNNEYTLTTEEYNELRNRFVEACIDKGYEIDYSVFYPRYITSNCVCDRINSGVIDPEGNIYKCWEEIGEESVCVGEVGRNPISNLPKRYFDYMLFDPTLDKKCSKCIILPVCMGGGCPLRRSRDNIRNCEEQIKEIKKSIVKSYKLMNK